MASFFVGLDLGQSQDYTALAALEQLAGDKPIKPIYHLRHLERLGLGTSYPDAVNYVQGLMAKEPLQTNAVLVVDSTGVGRPVIDLLDKAGLKPVAITITGGDAVSSDENGFRVPKRDLVSTLQILFQAGHLKVAEGLPLVQFLVQELLNFRVKIDLKTAHDSYGAWREGTHDDLVLAEALAAWYGEYAWRSPGVIATGRLYRGMGRHSPWR